MNDPILRLEILRNNLVESISNMELLFSTPVLLVDINNIPEGGIEKLIEEWKSFNPIVPCTPCEITYKIDEKYQKMIDVSKEHLSLVNQEIQKFKNLNNMKENNTLAVALEVIFRTMGSC